MDRIKGVNSECDRTPIVNPARWCPYHRFHADAVAALFAQPVLLERMFMASEAAYNQENIPTAINPWEW